MNKSLPVAVFLLFATLFSVSANPTDTVRVSATVCDSVSWFGISFYSDTAVTHLVTHEEGRDTLYMLTLYVKHSVHTDTCVTACTSYEWQGLTFTVSGDYEVGRYPAANGCDSVVTLHLTIVPPPPVHAINGDTLVCHGQRVTFSYPIDDPDFDQYWYLWYFVPDTTPMGTNVSSIVWDVEDDSPSVVTVGMWVVSYQYECIVADTTLVVHVCGESSPERAQVKRKSNSDILVCSEVEDPDGIVHYRWGYTDKQTLEEEADNWDHNYYNYTSHIDTTRFCYWVETYLIHGGVICRNRTVYGETVDVEAGGDNPFDVMACLSGDRLLLQVDNPTELSAVATLCDITGRMVAHWDLGSEQSIRQQLPFNYPGGIYLLSVQAGGKRHTIKLYYQR